MLTLPFSPATVIPGASPLVGGDTPSTAAHVGFGGVPRADTEVMTDISRAVSRFASAFDARLTTAHSASSPLGLWLLEALLAPYVEDGSQCLVLGEALGVDRLADAHDAALDLLREPHPSVALALAAWSRDLLLSPFGREVLASLPADVARAVMPSQEDADTWTVEHTGGLIQRFPTKVENPDLAFVLSSALAAKVTWRVPYEVCPHAAEHLGGSFAEHTTTFLESARDDACRIYRTSHGLVGVHAARSVEGLVVLSVIGSPSLPVAQTWEVAYEATALAAAGTAPLDLFDLELVSPRAALAGEGPGWSLTEEVRPLPRRAQKVLARMSTWRATRDELDISAAPGLGPLGATLARMVLDPTSLEARQSALAEFSTTGFQAAAVTSVGVRARAMPPALEPHPYREAILHYNRPYAVIALVDDETSPWHHVPVFSAWVEYPQAV